MAARNRRGVPDAVGAGDRPRRFGVTIEVKTGTANAMTCTAQGLKRMGCRYLEQQTA
jgi:hypothetical protein